MKRLPGFLVLALAAFAFASAHAQVAVVPTANHERMLASPDARLAANKRLVYDFWREVFEAGHMELVPKYLTETYIQHNPNVRTGRVIHRFLFQECHAQSDRARVSAPLVAIVAEGDTSSLAFMREAADPKDSTKKYTTTWFDMFGSGRKNRRALGPGKQAPVTADRLSKRYFRPSRCRSHSVSGGHTVIAASTSSSGTSHGRIAATSARTSRRQSGT
jgi:predicted SnoaL-like aldol condensation-catalyzing enzyme